MRLTIFLLLIGSIMFMQRCISNLLDKINSFTWSRRVSNNYLVSDRFCTFTHSSGFAVFCVGFCYLLAFDVDMMQSNKFSVNMRSIIYPLETMRANLLTFGKNIFILFCSYGKNFNS